MSFPKYEKYKDSGVEWLGEVPERWNIMRLKHLSESLKAGPFGSALTKDMYESSGYRVYGQEQVIPGDFSIGDYYISSEVFGELRQYEVRPQDILISCVGTFGKVAVAPDDISPGVINPRLIRLRASKLILPYYLSLVLRSEIVYEQFSLLSRGGTMDVINIGTLSDIFIPVPPLKQQAQIARFLDYETTRIDALIAEQSRLIALLKEKRQAVISHAVTKGFDATVEMKDSGVEWLGEVPEHWEVKKVTYACDIHNNLRTPIDRDIRAQKSGPYPYYGPTGILDYLDEFHVEGEYFLLGEDGDHFLKFNDKPMTIKANGKFCVNNHAHLIKGKHNCSTDWAAMCFETRDLSPFLIKQGVARYKLRKEILASIQICVPPNIEQEEIVKNIARKKALLNTSINQAKESIDLLQERRSALISAAVTGKIDVRDWQPPADVSPTTAAIAQ